MTARWQYLYETTKAMPDCSKFTDGFNKHLNERAAEGWELVSAETTWDKGWRSARLIWRR
jgi:hypothetical protein